MSEPSVLASKSRRLLARATIRNVRVLTIVCVAGCWQDTPATQATLPASPQVTIDPGTPATAAPSAPIRRSDSPYRDVAGTWKGVGYQYDTRTRWDLEMTLQSRGNIGDVIGTIAYENGKCTGELIRQPERDGGDTLAMTEKLVTGLGQCVDGGTIRIPRRPSAGELEWKWDWADGHEGASSTIKRE